MNRPAGTVTFLFTDIEGSTKLWETYPETMRTSLARHDALMREAIGASNGYVFKTIGDAFCTAFATASEALDAVLAAQLTLVSEPWPEETPIKVRMALHTGAVESRDNDYFGQPVNRVARLLHTAHGGQNLLSQTTYDLVRDYLPESVSLRDLGIHQLKDLARPEQVFQVLHPLIRADFPYIKSLSTHSNNLPQQVTSFVGREKESKELRSLLDACRLVTLTGSGGTGKTRLSLQIAADVLERYPDGAWLVELAPLTDPNLVASTVVNVLGLKEEAAKPLQRTLTEYLRNKQALLILDNCEHLLTACAVLADSLLRTCPHVVILATSREGLGISGETAYRVPSLSLPDPRQIQTSESLSQYESVRLFIDRASQAQTTFAVTNQNAPALASICYRLDGIPLAIELAAARVRTLSLEEINSKLDQRFRLLTGGSRTALPRQQTLRSLIDWSYDLLSDAEKALLCRLSVFLGGWILEAAESVCSGDPVEDWEMLDLLTSLCDKSLVVVDQHDSATRYRLLETVWQYARDRLLESGESTTWRDRHLAHFVAQGEEAEPHLRGAEQQVWLERLEREHDNLRVALEWAAKSGGETPGNGEAGLRLAGAFWRFWSVRGHLSEGRERLSRALAAAGEADAAIRAKALHGAGGLASIQSDYAAARAFQEESLALYREVGDRRGIAGALGNLGVMAREQGDNNAARAFHEESLAISRELGDRLGSTYALTNLGIAAMEQGDYAVGRALFQESLAIRQELGDRWGSANALTNLGIAAKTQGDYAVAQGHLEESLAISRELGDRRGIAITLTNLGVVAREQGDYAAARGHLEESLTLCREVGDRRGSTYALEGLATISTSHHTARLWGAAERLREEIGAPILPSDRSRYEQRVAAARAALGDDAAFDSAWAEGRTLTLDQAIDRALEK